MGEYELTMDPLQHANETDDTTERQSNESRNISNFTREDPQEHQYSTPERKPGGLVVPIDVTDGHSEDGYDYQYGNFDYYHETCTYQTPSQLGTLPAPPLPEPGSSKKKNKKPKPAKPPKEPKEKKPKKVKENKSEKSENGATNAEFFQVSRRWMFAAGGCVLILIVFMLLILIVFAAIIGGLRGEIDDLKSEPEGSASSMCQTGSPSISCDVDDEFCNLNLRVDEIDAKLENVTWMTEKVTEIDQQVDGQVNLLNEINATLTENGNFIRDNLTGQILSLNATLQNLSENVTESNEILGELELKIDDVNETVIELREKVRVVEQGIDGLQDRVEQLETA